MAWSRIIFSAIGGKMADYYLILGDMWHYFSKIMRKFAISIKLIAA